MSVIEFAEPDRCGCSWIRVCHSTDADDYVVIGKLASAPGHLSFVWAISTGDDDAAGALIGLQRIDVDSRATAEAFIRDHLDALEQREPIEGLPLLPLGINPTLLFEHEDDA